MSAEDLGNALYYGDLDKVKAAVEAGASVSNNGVMIYKALSCDDDKWEPIAAYLLEKGADVNEINHANMTPLMSAVWDGKLDRVKWLVETAKVDLFIARKDTGETAEEAADDDSEIKTYLRAQRIAALGEFATPLDEFISDVAACNKDIDEKIAQFSKKELQDNFEKLVTEGLIKGIQNNNRRGRSFKLAAVIRKLKDEIVPRILKKNVHVVAALGAAVAAYDPAEGCNMGRATNEVKGDLVGPVIEIILPLLKEPENIEKLAPAIMDFFADARKGEEGKAIAGFNAAAQVLAQGMQIAEKAPEVVARHNEQLVDVLCNDPSYCSMAALMLNKSYKHNPEPVHEQIEEIGDALEQRGVMLASSQEMFGQMASLHPTKLEPIVEIIIDLASDTMQGGMWLKAVLAALASSEMRDKTLPMLEKIEASPNDFCVQTMSYAVGDFLGALGSQSAELGERCFKLLMGMAKHLVDTNQGQSTATLALALRRMYCTSKKMPVESLDPYMEQVNAWEANGAISYLQEAAVEMKRRRENRDLDAVNDKVDSVEAKTEENAAKIETVAADASEAKDLATSANETALQANEKADTAVAQSSAAAADAAEAKQQVGEVKADVETAKADAADAKATANEVSSRVDNVESDVQQAKSDAATALAGLKELEATVDARFDEMKEFLADVAKKLPVPASFESKNQMGGAVKKLVLHFHCDAKNDDCLYNGKDSSFTTDTKTANKWLKVCYAGVKLGLSVVGTDPIGTLEGLKDVYDKVREPGYDAEFKAFCSEPFLTSSEQDSLINQLRDKDFFNYFVYNAQSARWECTKCGRATADASAAKKAETAEKVQAAREENPAKAEEVAAEKAAAAAAEKEKADAAAAAAASSSAAAAAAPSSSSAASGAVSLPMRGVFFKQSRRLKKFIEREFLLDSSSLTHFNVGKSKAKLRLEASTFRRVAAVDKSMFNREALALTCDDGVLYYAFSDSGARDQWLAALDHVIGLQK